MMKISSKRRRTRKEIQQDKLAEANREADLQAKMAMMAEAEEKLANFDQMNEELMKHRQLFQEMQAVGAIEVDAHGNVSPSKQKPQAEFQNFDQH